LDGEQLQFPARYLPTGDHVVIDHVSTSWGQDENVYFYPGAGGVDANVTVWKSLIAEGLRNAPGSDSACGQFEDGKGFSSRSSFTGLW